MILLNRGVVILTWFPVLGKIVFEALFPSAALHFQSVIRCLPHGYNKFHQSFNDNDIETMLTLVMGMGDLFNWQLFWFPFRVSFFFLREQQFFHCKFFMILLLFYVFIFWPKGMWDLFFPIRDWIGPSALEDKVFTTDHQGSPSSVYLLILQKLWKLNPTFPGLTCA